MPDNLPLRIYCRNCGAPAGFDIVRQTYRCPNCGETTGIEDASDRVLKWKVLQKNSRTARKEGSEAVQYSCTGCGAVVEFGAGEASANCDFCGSKLIRRELLKPSQLPDLVIPFVLTESEAKARLSDWADKHALVPEGRKLKKNLDHIRGYYLPYQLVRGPVTGTVDRDSTIRTFKFGGFLEGAAVTSVAMLDNQVLDGMEPFDWDAAQLYEHGFVAGHKVRFADVSDKEVTQRVVTETEAAFRPRMEQVMDTTGISVHVNPGMLMSVYTLLPVYFIHTNELDAACNGQTGRVSVSMHRRSISYPWVIEPAFLTVLATVLLSIPYRFNPEAVFLFGSVFALLFFSIYSVGREPLIRNVIYSGRRSAAVREDEELHITEGRDALKNPFDNTPVFFERDPKTGETIPVRLRFWTVGRVIGSLVRMLITFFLPVPFAALIRLAAIDGTNEKFFDNFKIGYGAAWYCIGAFLCILYLTKGMRQGYYEKPYIYDLRTKPNKLIGNAASRRAGILTMFGIGETDAKGEKFTLRDFLRAGGLITFLVVTLLVLLIGSAFAIAT